MARIKALAAEQQHNKKKRLPAAKQVLDKQAKSKVRSSSSEPTAVEVVTEIMKDGSKKPKRKFKPGNRAKIDARQLHSLIRSGHNPLIPLAPLIRLFRSHLKEQAEEFNTNTWNPEVHNFLLQESCAETIRQVVVSFLCQQLSAASYLSKFTKNKQLRGSHLLTALALSRNRTQLHHMVEEPPAPTGTENAPATTTPATAPPATTTTTEEEDEEMQMQVPLSEEVSEASDN